jgi:hypothetical protein
LNSLDHIIILNSLNQTIYELYSIYVFIANFQPLARLGAFVVGLDPVEESTKIAQLHLEEDPNLLPKIKYITGIYHLQSFGNGHQL